MKKIFNLSLLLSIILIPSTALAELVIIGGNSWDYEVSGKIRDSGTVTDEINLKNDLHLKDDSEGFLLAYIEHPVPLLPNIRLGSTSLDLSGSGLTTIAVNYNGTTLSANVNTTTKLDLSHTEVGLYWNILDNAVGLDLGLNVKFFDGTVSITDGTTTASDIFDETIPLLYAGLQFELPYGLQLAGDLSYISFDGSSVTDTLIRLRYTSDYALGVEVGYRSFVIDYEDTSANEYADVDISGTYIGVHLAF